MDQPHPTPPPMPETPVTQEAPITNEVCLAVPTMLGYVADKWTVLVIGRLSQGSLRYKELQREVDGISQRMLTLTLKRLEEGGLIVRTVFPTIPPRVDYELSDLGHSLREVLSPLHNWVMTHREEMEAARAAFARRTHENR
jgi:DNA-binding HxlR family transcriptional regulator